MSVTPEKRLDAKFRKRLKRRLHYGDMADLDAPSMPLTELSVDYFHDSAPGKLGHVDLETASNIVRQNKVTPCSMVVSVLYARRLRQRNRQYLDSMSSSDVFFISMMMASKYMYDEGTDDEVYNDEWAASVDQEVCDVNKMEMEFLQAMDWRLFVRPEEFEETLNAIEKRLALQEGLKRGWFTYAELDVLMGPDLIGSVWSGVATEVSKLLATLSAAYLTSLLSMMGSVALATQVSGPLASASVALMALHSSPGSMSPGENLSLSPLQVSIGKVHLCGPADECLGLAEVDDDGLVVEFNLEDLNKTAAKEKTSVDLASRMQQESVKKMILHDAGRGYLPEGSSDVNGEDEKLGQAKNYVTVEEDNDSPNRQRSSEEKEPIKVSASPSRPMTSSLWSLWFLDSLLSQIWSLTASKPQAARKRPVSCLKQKRFVETQRGVENLNVQDSGACSEDYFGESTVLHSRLIDERAQHCDKCFSKSRRDPTTTEKGRSGAGSYGSPQDGLKPWHHTSQERLKPNIGDFCRRISFGHSNVLQDHILASHGNPQNPLHNTRQGVSAKSKMCSSPVIGPGSDSSNYLNHGLYRPASSGWADPTGPGLYNHHLGENFIFERSVSGNNCHRADTTGDEFGTQAYLFNLPTTLFSGVYRMLQVA